VNRFGNTTQRKQRSWKTKEEMVGVGLGGGTDQ